MPPQRLRTVALLARTPGLLVLADALLDHPELELAAVFTHGMLPKAEGGAPRTEVEEFQNLADVADVPLHIVDGAAAKDITELLPDGPLDLLISCSWRNLVPAHVLARFEYGCINLHRGALPAYAGARPVERALAAGEQRIAITAHEMTEEIDAGDEISEVWLDIAHMDLTGDAAIDAETVKHVLEQLYAPLALVAIRSKIVSIDA